MNDIVPNLAEMDMVSSALSKSLREIKPTFSIGEFLFGARRAQAVFTFAAERARLRMLKKKHEALLLADLDDEHLHDETSMARLLSGCIGQGVAEGRPVTWELVAQKLWARAGGEVHLALYLTAVLTVVTALRLVR